MEILIKTLFICTFISLLNGLGLGRQKEGGKHSELTFLNGLFVLVVLAGWGNLLFWTLYIIYKL